MKQTCAVHHIYFLKLNSVADVEMNQSTKAEITPLIYGARAVEHILPAAETRLQTEYTMHFLLSVRSNCSNWSLRLHVLIR